VSLEIERTGLMTRGFLRFLRRNTIALLALFLALGGTTYAASTALIGKNTVASPQVVNGSLGTKDLSKRARAALKGNRGLRGFTGAQGAQGAKGATGAQGIQGIQGPAGTAVAYATVLAGGTIDTSAGTQAKNLADANISHPATGIYCFGDLSFTPQSALVSAGNLSVVAAAIVTVGVDERPTPNLTGCVVGVSRVRVRVHDAAGAALDAPFTIWFQ
jgi:hypothetical protein